MILSSKNTKIMKPQKGKISYEMIENYIKYFKKKNQFRNPKISKMQILNYFCLKIPKFYFNDCLQYCCNNQQLSSSKIHKMKNDFNNKKDNLVQIFEYFRKSMNKKILFNKKAIEYNPTKYSESNQCREVLITKKATKIKNRKFLQQFHVFIRFNDQFDLSQKLKRQILFIDTFNGTNIVMNNKNVYQVFLSTNKILMNYELYKSISSTKNRKTKKEIKELHRESSQKIRQIFDELNKIYIQKVHNVNDEMKQLLFEVNLFVLRYSSLKSDLKTNWMILSPKFAKIGQILQKTDQIYQLIIQSFQNIKKYNHSKVIFNTNQKNSLISNINSVFKSINIFFDFLLNNQSKNQSKIIEKKLFNVIFHPINDDSFRTNVFSVYQMHDNLVYSSDSFMSLSSSTGSGKTRCAPFFFSIKAIQENMKIPFIIMTQPRYSIIKTKIDDFKSIFGNSIEIVTNINKMFSLYKKYDRKDINFHPRFIKPIFGLFTSQSLLELIKMCEKNDIDICAMTRFCLDEIHERTVETDVLCAVLSNKAKEMVKQKKNFPLQLLLMSATPDTHVFNCYDKIVQFKLPESHLFPVETIRHEVENVNKINSVVVFETTNLIKQMGNNELEKGHILIFTSGNFRMKGIQRSLIDKIERKCSTDFCIVKVVDNFDSLFEDENVEQFYSKIDQFIEHETKKFNFFKNKNQTIMFVLPIKYLGYDSKEQKEICINPIPQHPNLIKVIMATNAIESSITIDNLAAVIDSGIFNHYSCSRENGLTDVKEEQITIQSQIQRKGRVGRLRSGVSVKITKKNQEIQNSLTPLIQSSDISLNILLLRKIGYKIEEIENLPDKIKESEKENYISELVSINALTNDTHELTSLGNILIKFDFISPYISAAIISVSDYKVEDYEKLNSISIENREITHKELLILLGCLITLIISNSDIAVNKYAKKLREFFDKRSDIITLLRTILELAQFQDKEIRNKEDEYGLDSRSVLKILGQLQKFVENFFFSNQKEEQIQNRLNAAQKKILKKEEDRKKHLIWKNIAKSLKELVDDLMTDDFLNVFILMLIEQIGNNKSEWIESRKVEFFDIEDSSYEPVFLFKGELPEIGLLMRPGGIGLDCPSKGFILSIIHDDNSKLNYGFLIHSDGTDENDDFIPHPLSIETNLLLNNDFAIPLLNSYFWGDWDHFQPFCSGYCRSSDDYNTLFEKSKEVVSDSDNQEHLLISFIPKNEEAIKMFENAIEIIGHLLPYTASNILIPNHELNVFVSLYGEGKERIESWVHFFDDEDFYPYQLNKDTIDFLHDHIEVLKLKNETFKIAITGEPLCYPLEKMNNYDKSTFKSSKIKIPFANSQITSVFDEENPLQSRIIMTSTLKIDHFIDKNYLLRWNSEKIPKLVTEKEQEMIQKANNIAKETITFNLSFYRLVFMTVDSILQAKGRAPSSYGVDDIPKGIGPLQKIFYLCSLNHIQGDSLITPLNFRGFYYRGKPVKILEDVKKIPDTRFKYLGNSCIALDVLNESSIDFADNEIHRIYENENIDFGLEIHPVYRVDIKHSLNSKLSKEEFIKRVDSVLDQFGGVIANKCEYIEMQSKFTGYQGMIKVFMYWANFTIPLAGMIKKVLEENEVDPFINILNNTIDTILFNDRKVQKALNDWFAENDVQFKQDSLQLVGDDEKIKQVIIKFKKNPPKIPFKSYPVPERLNILQINAHLNRINRMQVNKWYLNKFTRTLYVPLEVNENEVQEFLKKYEINSIKDKKIEEEDILWELYIHDDDENEEENAESLLSRKLISIFIENGEKIQKHYCVKCLQNTLLFNLRKMYNQDEDSCSMMEIYDDDKFLQNIGLIENDSSNRIPLGQMIWSFVKEQKITNLIRTWMTAVAIRGLKRSKKITYCPLHPNILIPKKYGFTVNCTIPSCKFYFCLDCQQWHQIGKCEKEPSISVGTRICPFCNESVEKSQACNHIHCQCGRDFCYYCGQGFESPEECYTHMGKENHWVEAPDYERFILRKSIKNEVLKQFYEKYPKWKPKWMDEEEDISDNEIEEN